MQGKYLVPLFKPFIASSQKEALNSKEWVSHNSQAFLTRVGCLTTLVSSGSEGMAKSHGITWALGSYEDHSWIN